MIYKILFITYVKIRNTPKKHYVFLRKLDKAIV